MTQFDTSQQALIDSPDSIWVEACPGAGKTQAIVERFITRLHSDSRRGVALLSFTNAAVDEARARCRERPELLRAPNFVGTIDSFINRFIVRPAFTNEKGKSPIFVDTWETLAGTTFKSPKGLMRLGWFRFDFKTGARLDVKILPQDSQHAIGKLPDHQLRNAERWAERRWARLLESGVLDAATSRSYMGQCLENLELRGKLGCLLRARFSKVIVDEVQDCTDQDEQMLLFLLDVGIRLVVVGDSEQAIFGFRGAHQSGLATLRGRLREGARLNKNYRSSATICRMVDSLRAGVEKDLASGPNKDVPEAVRLLRYRTWESIKDEIVAAVENSGYTREQIIVLAHNGTDAYHAVGLKGSPKGAVSDNKIFKAALACHGFRDPLASPRVRTLALQRISAALQEMADDGRLRDMPETEFLEAIHTHPREYRAKVLRVILDVSDPFLVTPQNFQQSLKQAVGKHGLNWVKTFPAPKKWPYKLSGSSFGLNYSTIHSFKGLQSPVVALIIPKPLHLESGLDLWEREEAGESRRVLYVGVSRAERLLIVAAHDTVYDRVASVMNRDGVGFVSTGN